MKADDFNQLIDSIQEAGKIRRGEKKPGRTFEFNPEDVREIRKNLGKSQTEFALMIGVSVATLRNWEQGRRVPDGPARSITKSYIKKSESSNRSSK